MDILLIEDDEGVGSSFTYALNRKGNNVHWAGQIKEAWELLKKNVYDVILLDIKLPDGDGFSFCISLRKKIDTPIVFITACDEEKDIIKGLEIGGDDYITKPVRINELIARINAVIRRTKKSKISLIKTGDMKVYPDNFEIIINEEKINITPTEFNIILYLINNRNQVITKDKLLDYFWDSKGNYIDSNSLNVYMKRLREKIEDDIKCPKYIKTVRGVGYRWGMDINEF